MSDRCVCDKAKRLDIYTPSPDDEYVASHRAGTSALNKDAGNRTNRKPIKRDTGLLVENVRSVIVSDAESRSETNSRDVLAYDGGIEVLADHSPLPPLSRLKGRLWCSAKCVMSRERKPSCSGSQT